MRQAVEHSLRQIGRHRNRAVILFTSVMGLLWLVLLAWNVQRVQELAAQAALYEQAPRCEQEQRAGCRAIEQVRVTHVEEWRVGRGVRHSFTVRRADGRTEVVDEAAGDLYPQVREGTMLEAEVWQGAIVRLRDSLGHESASWDDPAWAQANNTTGVYVTAGLVAVSFALTFYAWRRGHVRDAYQ